MPVVRALVSLLAAWSMAIIAPAQAREQSQPVELDRESLEAWADRYYGQAVEDKRSAAIGVTVVKDGEILLQKAYGYRDYGEGIPADPQTTGFMVGSITKTIVATAVGQLVDSGRISSLDDPVNKYLKRFKLPGKRGAKVTIAHLLNHRAGFEDVDFGFISGGNSRVDVPVPASELKRFLPDIVREPGGAANYNNWGFSLLGFMIEDIVDERLDTYLKRVIFDPLGMKNTLLWYDEGPTHDAVHYRFTKDGQPVLIDRVAPHPWIAPAGTVISTPSDMALYMNAHLLKGRDGGTRLLSDEMFEKLHRETYRNAPISLGFGHAFWTNTLGGFSTIEHGGGTPAFQSMMTMIPEQKIGFFVSSVQSGLADGQEYTEAELASDRLVKEPVTGFELRESFAEEFFAAPAPFADGPKYDLNTFPGQYLSSARVYNTIEKLGVAFDPSKQMEITVSENGEGLEINGYGPYIQVGNGVFRNAKGNDKWTDPYTINPFHPDHIAFKMSDDGTPQYLVAGLGDQIWEPVSPIFNPQAMLQLFMVLAPVLLTGILMFAWPIANRFKNLPNWVCLGLSASIAAMIYAVIGGFDTGDSLSYQMALGNKGRLWMLAIGSNAIVFLGLILLLLKISKRFNVEGESATWAVRAHGIHGLILAVAALALVPAFLMFNLVGFHLPG